jgi:thiamine transporter ThiT
LIGKKIEVGYYAYPKKLRRINRSICHLFANYECRFFGRFISEILFFGRFISKTDTKLNKGLPAN